MIGPRSHVPAARTFTGTTADGHELMVTVYPGHPVAHVATRRSGESWSAPVACREEGS